MDWKPKARSHAGSAKPARRIVWAGGASACSLALAIALVAGAALHPQAACAAGLWAGQWQQAPTTAYLKLAQRVDTALVAQDPKPKVKTTKSERTKTITVTVTCRAKKAGIQNAKSKRARAYASMAMKLFAPGLYRDETSVSYVSAKKTVHGVNNYGRDRSSDCSLNVGRSGTADVYVRYEGLLCTYKKGTFRKANFENEVYFNQTRRVKVASVELPEDYRLKLQLRKR